MFTKEAQNVAESFPNFLKLLLAVQNPMAANVSKNAIPENWEPVTKAIWFVVPFHFLTFLGQGGSGPSDITYLVFVGICALLGLMWLGTFLGVIPARRNELTYEERSKVWVSTLVVTWFFCVFGATSVAFMIWAVGGFSEGWPNLPEHILVKVLNGTGPAKLFLAIAAATFGTVCLVGFKGLKAVFARENSGAFSVWFVGTAWLVCAVLMFASAELLSL